MSGQIVECARCTWERWAPGPLVALRVLAEHEKKCRDE